VELIARHKAPLLKLAAQVDRVLRNGREGCLNEALEAIDAVLFAGEVTRGELASARISLHERRQARSRSGDRKARIVLLSPPDGT
jgi:hypothetical protein